MKDRRKTDRGRIEDLERKLRQTTIPQTGPSGSGGSSVSLSSATPQPIGTSTAGVSSSVSRDDHVHTLTSAIIVTFDGNGSALVSPMTTDIYMPFGCTILSATILADQSGSATVDIEKDTYGSYPPTGADSIVASAKPTISAATKSTDSTLTGWVTSVSSGDTLRFVLDSSSTVTRVVLTLAVRRT